MSKKTKVLVWGKQQSSFPYGYNLRVCLYLKGFRLYISGVYKCYKTGDIKTTRYKLISLRDYSEYVRWIKYGASPVKIVKHQALLPDDSRILIKKTPLRSVK